MARFVHSPELVQEFRWDHRLKVRRLRAIKRMKLQAKPRDVKTRDLDRDLDRAIERDDK